MQRRTAEPRASLPLSRESGSPRPAGQPLSRPGGSAKWAVPGSNRGPLACKAGRRKWPLGGRSPTDTGDRPQRSSHPCRHGVIRLQGISGDWALDPSPVPARSAGRAGCAARRCYCLSREAESSSLLLSRESGSPRLGRGASSRLRYPVAEGALRGRSASLGLPSADDRRGRVLVHAVGLADLDVREAGGGQRPSNSPRSARRRCSPSIPPCRRASPRPCRGRR